MKKIRNLSLVFVSVIGLGCGTEDNQPPFTTEMTALGLTPFASKRETIERIYLVDDEQWGENLEKARCLFGEIEQLKRKNGETKELIYQYWSLSQQYDYGPANEILRFSFSAGYFGLTKNIAWGLFFGSKSQDEYDMDFKRRACLSYGDSLFADASDSDSDAVHHDHSSALDAEKLLRSMNCVDADSNVMEVLTICNQKGMTHKKISKKFCCSESLVQKFLSGQTSSHKLVTSVHDYYKNGGASLLESLEEAENQKKAAEATTWHFSDLFYWISRKSTASSRSSNEGTPPNASFSSRATTPPKDDERDECQPLLGSATKYIQPNDGLRRRHVVGKATVH
ncbi:MAG: hypothetical protein NEHIOOID_01398 [Holosporales bacterium]